MWTEVIVLLAGVGTGYALHAAMRRYRRLSSHEGNREALYEIVRDLGQYYIETAQPNDLLQNNGFREGTELLAAGSFTTAELCAYCRGDNHLIACMALEALRRREDAGPDLLFDMMNTVANWPRFFVLRALATAPEAVVTRLLARIDATWQDAHAQTFLRDFLAQRLEKETVEACGELEPMDPDKVGWVASLLESIGTQHAQRLAAALRTASAGHVDVDFLRSIGTVRERTDDVLEHPELTERAGEIERTLTDARPRSVMLVGETGVGKTATLHVVANRLLDAGWTVFEAGASQLIADQVFVGQLEGRMRELIDRIRAGTKVLWIVPDMHAFLSAGRGQHHPASVLDILLPHLAAGEVVLAGEIQPQGWERLVRSKPELRTAVEAIRVAPLDDAGTRELALAWARHHGRNGKPIADEATIAEALRLAQQLLGETAPPGNLLRLLELGRQGHRTPNRAEPSVLTVADLLRTLSRLTGLPSSILDEREPLGLDRLRGFFEDRVLGQPEAVDCLVERVAMIKAGLTDPDRPQGVFLFTGPTGTGKTEIARTLAAFLFGSPARLMRLDMSEFQEAASLDRLLGSAFDLPGQASLADQIRRQPFSVVLLDEIEKASPAVWDLLLQVFDAGRLTDRQGKLADFRHAIFIMTSNLGSEALGGRSLGFGADGAAHDRSVVDRALDRSFRPEFLNRLDRVVVFRPLPRATMRRILLKELGRALDLRGLRNRDWAVEWDESALDFLLDKGFTEQLGARPLRRAVERYVLTPLAVTIVNREAPAGDQFLFLRSDGKSIEVVFIDPDEPASAVEPLPAPSTNPGDLTLGPIVLDGSGSRAEVDFLGAELGELAGEVDHLAWQARKQAALTATSAPDFWKRRDRFVVLGLYEYMERVESGVEIAQRLYQRLAGGAVERRPHRSPELTRRLAQQLHLIRAAIAGINEDRPRDAFLDVEALHDPRTDGAAADAFATRIAAMYRAWARKRSMELAVLRETPAAPGSPYGFLASVSGYGAFGILLPEHGLHVLEAERPGRSPKRCRARVRIAPQPAEPPGAGGPLAQAATALATTRKAEPDIVRTYREKPSPLVRDRVRGWRSGRWDRVLGGDFDLLD